MDRKIKVCIIIEGSYPYITGGVSSWIHQLINALPGIDFILYTISPRKNQKTHYTFPPNVIGHHDIIISRKSPVTQKTNKHKNELMKKIVKLHESLLSRTHPHLEQMEALMPRGYYLYEDSVDNEDAWNHIVLSNQKNNPAYPFADYFWAWKSSHDMLFTVLGEDPPEADIYHAVSTGYAGLAGVMAKIKTGNPLLLTEHGLYHKEREIEIKRVNFVKGYQRDMWTKIYNTLSRITYQYSDLIISLFEHNRRLQIEMGASPDICKVIPNGIDIEYFSEIQREEREGFHVGLIGRVVPIKDIKCFILTCKIISEQIPEARFYCIGPTDEDAAYYEECVTLVKSFKLQDTFEFTGRMDVRQSYAFLDVMLLTSVREAQPLVILEGFAAGVPCVCTRVGNVPELLDYDDRFIANSKDSEKLAAGVKFIHDNPGEMKNIKKKNKEKVHKLYNRKELHMTYGKIYNDYYKRT